MLAGACLFLTSPRMTAENAPGTGIEGNVTVSPIHGGPSKMGEPDSAPLANAILMIETAAGTIKTITTDEKGYFKVELPPGRYAIRTQKIGMRGRGCAMNDVEVTAGSFRQVKLDCDTGMR
jgi:hypothetical protein